MIKKTLVSLIGIVAAGALHAQEVPPFTFNVGAGFTNPIGTFGRYNDVGWNVQGGAGFNFNSWASLMADVGFNNMGINSNTLAYYGAPGGTAQIWSFTLDPVVHLTGKRRFDLYVTGGGGDYRVQSQLTTPAGGFVPTPFGAVPAFGNYVLSSYSVNKPGFDAGLGVNLGSKWRAKFYAEAKYNRIYTSNGVTDFIPVTFGMRF
jgi:hypothetical protein